MGALDDLKPLPYDRLVICYHQYAEQRKGDVFLRVKEGLIDYHGRQVLIRKDKKG